ncbi:MAG: heme o synthase [Bacteriovoracaceae bacterium]
MLYRVIVSMALLATFCLLLLGGYVHNTESSLACPDWPLCYGQFFPKMEGGILIEHSHRLLASFVGFLTILMVVFSRKLKSTKNIVYTYSPLALLFVIVQGILGGITVIYKLPTIVSTTHLGLSMVFFLTLIYLHHYNGEAEVHKSKQSSYPIYLRSFVLISLGLFYFQMILGAFMRHSGAGASCGLSYDNAIWCLDLMRGQTFWPTEIPARVHMTHRILAVVVGLFTIFTSVQVFKFLKGSSKRLYSVLYIIVVLVQIGLGIITVGTNIRPFPTTLHLGFAALGLGLLFKMELILRDSERRLFPNGLNNLLTDLFELTKPNLSLLVLVSCFVGMMIHPGHIDFFKAINALVLIFFVVAGSCALNCYIEKDVDKLMDRTKMRALPSGRITPKTALIFGLVLLGVSIPLLAAKINFMTAFLALLAALLYLFVYTPLKQKSEKAVYVGAIPGAIPPVMGWTSVGGEVAPMAYILFAILFLWQLPHFLAISIYHADDYRSANIKVYPNLKTSLSTEVLIFIMTIVLVLATLLPWYISVASVPYTRTAVFLGVIFSGYAALGLLKRNNFFLAKKWARNYFIGSIIYLPLLFAALMFFK